MDSVAIPARATEGRSKACASTASPCILCGSTEIDGERSVLDRISGESFRTVCCSRCGLRFVSPAPAIRDLERYYPSRQQGAVPAAYELADAVSRERHVARLLGNRAGAILDVGCGKGLLLSRLRARGWKVFGTELGEQSSRYARETLQLPVFSESVERCAALDQASFDVVTLYHSLEHMSDPAAVIERARALLRPDGLILVEVPNAGCWQAKLFGPRWFHDDVPRHLFHFDRDNLLSLFARTGFAVESISTHNLIYDAFGAVQSSLNTIFARQNLLNDVNTGQTSLAEVWRSPRRWRDLAALAIGELAMVLAMPIAIALILASAPLLEGSVLRFVGRKCGR